MSIPKDLFLALLSLDAYNRGYASGIGGLTDALGTQLGAGSVSKRLQDISEDFRTNAQAAGIYAIAYEVGDGVDGLAPGSKVISYRGKGCSQMEVP
jgi:hypothetical protein